MNFRLLTKSCTLLSWSVPFNSFNWSKVLQLKETDSFGHCAFSLVSISFPIDIYSYLQPKSFPLQGSLILFSFVRLTINFQSAFTNEANEACDSNIHYPLSTPTHCWFLYPRYVVHHQNITLQIVCIRLCDIPTALTMHFD